MCKVKQLEKNEDQEANDKLKKIIYFLLFHCLFGSCLTNNNDGRI